MKVTVTVHDPSLEAGPSLIVLFILPPPHSGRSLAHATWALWIKKPAESPGEVHDSRVDILTVLSMNRPKIFSLPLPPPVVFKALWVNAPLYYSLYSTHPTNLWALMRFVPI